MASVAVIIPYYQKQAGILRRALESVIRQNLPSVVSVEIVIVDDGSPHPVDAEVAGFVCPASFRLNIVRQANSGVGAARNAALRAVAADTTYIAFLDSDDMWEADHLTTALTALEEGRDFYFCNAKRIQNAASVYEEGKFNSFLSSPDARSIGGDLFELDKQAFFDFSLRHWVSLLPTIVYRRSIAPDLRFEPSLHAAAEDCLFVFQYFQLCDGIVCSSRQLVSCMDGVNIFNSKFGWEDPGCFVRLMGKVLAFREYQKRLKLSSENNAVIHAKAGMVKKFFAFLTLRDFVRNRRPWPHELLSQIKNDPSFWFWYPISIVYIAVCYPLGLYHPVEDRKTA